jgi:nitrogen fixation protein FixH
MNRSGIRTLKGKHVLIAVLAFFAFVIAVNGIYIALAMWSWSGLSTEDAYQRGLAYNQTLAEAEAQRALNWQVKAVLEPMAGGGARLTVAFTDRSGAPVEGLTVSGDLRRPVRDDLDRAVDLVRDGPGRYGADVDQLAAGQWDVRLRATSPDGAIFVLEDRLWLP